MSEPKTFTNGCAIGCLVNFALYLIAVALVAYGSISFGTAYFAAAQLLITAPIANHFWKTDQPEVAKGVTAALGVSLLLGTMCWAITGANGG